MIFKIKARNDGSGRYGVTPFDAETGETLGALFGTKILASLVMATEYAETQVAKIIAVGDDASIEYVD